MLTRALNARGSKTIDFDIKNVFFSLFFDCFVPFLDCFELFLIVFSDFLKFLIKLGSRLFYCNLGPGPLVGQRVHGTCFIVW